MIWFLLILVFFWGVISAAVFFSDLAMGGTEGSGLLGNILYYILLVPVMVIYLGILDLLRYMRKKPQ